MSDNIGIIGKSYFHPKSIFITEIKKEKPYTTLHNNYTNEYSSLGEKLKTLQDNKHTSLIEHPENNFKKLFVLSEEKSVIEEAESIYNLIDSTMSKELFSELIQKKINLPCNEIINYEKKYKLSEPFGNVKLMGILPAKYATENIDFNFSDDIFVGSFLPSQNVHSNYHELIAPIDLGTNSGDSISIKISDICGMFNAHLFGKCYLSFSQKVNIHKIVFYQDSYNEQIIDTIYKSYLDILLELKIIQNITLSNGNYVIPLPFFFDDHYYAFPGFRYQNVYLKVIFSEKIKNVKVNLTASLYYLGQCDIERFINSKYLPSYFLQHGENYRKEIINISDNNAVVIKLDDFRYNISCIFIKLTPMNKTILKLYGTVMLNGCNVALIDPDINSMNVNNTVNLYMIPFTIDKKIGKNNPNGSLFVKQDSLQLCFKMFSENNIEPDNIEIEVFAPRYNIIKYRENNTLIISYE